MWRFLSWFFFKLKKFYTFLFICLHCLVKVWFSIYFNKYLVSLNFNDFYFLLNPIILISFLWVFFFKINTTLQKVSSENSFNLNNLKINSNSVFVGFYLILVIYLYINIYFIRGKNDVVWFNHFNLNNFTFNLLYLFIFVSFSTFFLLGVVISKKTNLLKSLDYLFSVNNLIILFPYLFFVNTLFTFLFFLELVSAILFYKLLSSKIWFKNTNTPKYINNNIPQNYINMIFFQYWVTFFSTIFIIYFYINIFYFYGTSEWFMIQFLNTNFLEMNQSQSNTLRVLVVVFLLGVCFKLGVTPFHLFKIEVYKGIPFLTIFFYTTYYFVVFFIFFIFLLSDFVVFFIPQYFLFLTILLFLGSIYVIVLLFDVSFLKAFFTYSTVINSIGFLIAFISSI